MINILIPCAGDGQRFADAGYDLPKPLINLCGKPLIQRVVESLNLPGRYIYAIRQEHQEKYRITELLRRITPDCHYFMVKEKTDGAASTCLLANEYINNDSPLVIANSDQVVEFDRPQFLGNLLYYHGSIITFWNNHPKWSYVIADKKGKISKVVEKEVVSYHANTGIYGFRRGRDFVTGVAMMKKDESKKVNGEWYIAPVYNELISTGLHIQELKCQEMLACGVPEDLEKTSQIISNRENGIKFISRDIKISEK